MIDDNPRVSLLSPPNSPRMSDAGPKSGDYQWQQPTASSLHTPTYALPPALSQVAPTRIFKDEKAAYPDLVRPSLRSVKSFPYTLGPSSRVHTEQGPDLAQLQTSPPFKPQATSQGPQPVGSADLPPPTFGGSAPTSPIGRLTPPTGEGASGVGGEEDEEMGFGGQGDGAEEEEERPPMTAAELRAQKRKMKRFRLTHNQTRFLMSEFARQPHPDAAHRERLSREIPGLSPRQVQVWFQNRRAKLKRLTTDDRERMMRSRALPANFDMTQALHSPFAASTQTAGTPMASPASFGNFGENSVLRPLTLDTVRRPSDYESYSQQQQQQYTTPTGITPAIGGFAFTPPQSATDTMSPGSIVSSAAGYTYQPQENVRRFGNGLPMAAYQGYGSSHPHIPRLQLHDRITRVGESAGSPLRTSYSYTGLEAPGDTGTSPDQERSASFSGQSSHTQDRSHQSRHLAGPMSAPSTGPGPVGLGFTYSQPAQYNEQPSPAIGVSASQAVTPQYRRASSHLAGPPLNAYSSYQTTSYSPPQPSQYPSYSSTFSAQHYSQPYQQTPHLHSHGQQQSFAGVPSQSQQYLGLGGTGRSSDEGDNSDGGVPLPPSY